MDYGTLIVVGVSDQPGGPSKFLYWRIVRMRRHPDRIHRAIARSDSTAHASSTTTMRRTPSAEAKAACNHDVAHVMRIPRADEE